VIAKHDPRAYVDDHQQPRALDLKLMLEPERVANDNLQPHIEPVTIEFDYLIRPRRRGSRYIVGTW
jgi:hypothetical protein